MSTLNNTLRSSIAALLLAGSASLVQAAGDGSSSRISDVPITPDYSDYERTKPLLELGEPFLDTGNIDPGFELPTGAVWQPQFLVWGDMRTALQDFDSGGTHTREWANRLNLFAQLRFSPTERLLMSFRPLDENDQFTGKQFEPNSDTVNGFNSRVRSFYFEGELGEIFPRLDPEDAEALDWGFAIGRQPLFTQEGILINDTIDAIGIVRNSVRIPGTSNTRVAAMYGWNEVHRDNNTEDRNAELYGLFIETDTPKSTIDIDLAYVDSDNNTGDGYFAAISGVQRFGHLATSLRLLHSKAKDQENASVSTGTLLFAETSFTPARTNDNVYINGFVGIDQFSSAARDVDTGGPLGRTGILYASVGLGGYGTALSNRPDDAWGGAIGYQAFLDGQREQLIIELGARDELKGAQSGAVALGARYQKAYGRHTILVLEGFANDTSGTGHGSGIRSELRWKF